MVQDRGLNSLLEPRAGDLFDLLREGNIFIGDASRIVSGKCQGY